MKMSTDSYIKIVGIYLCKTGVDRVVILSRKTKDIPISSIFKNGLCGNGVKSRKPTSTYSSFIK